MDSYANEPNSAVLYFYFYFNDFEKQRVKSCSRSIVARLSGRNKQISKSLQALYDDCGWGARDPSPDALERTLKSCLGEISQAFLVLDALDECVERDELCELIATIKGWNLPSPHNCY